MRYLKSISFLLLVLLSAFTLQTSKSLVTQLVITKGASLNVAGSTNINKFSCSIANYDKPDTLKLYKYNTEPVKISGELQLDVQAFDCHNVIMTSDLRKTLKAKEFPKLIIHFINLSKYPDFNHLSDVKGMVTIELAGTSKLFEVNYKFIPDGARAVTLLGSRDVKFSDFNLTPPRKIGGMIQTNNDLKVEFNLRLKILE
jgi:hypothetical protein